MNYTQLEKGFLTPSTFVACTLVTVLLYKFAKRRLQGNGTFLERMQYIYSMIAGGLLGQFFAHTLPNASVHPFSFSSDYAFVTGILLLGFYVIMWIQKCGRVNNTNPHYTGPGITLTEINHVVDSETMQEDNYVATEEVFTESFKEQMWTTQDEKAELKRRRQMAIILFCTMLVIQVFEGFYLVYRNLTDQSNRGLLIGMFVIDKLLESTIVIGALLHAYYHAKPGKALLILCLLWILAATLSTLPVLVDMGTANAQLVLQHPATSIFYALAGSVILWCMVYFIWVEPRQTSKKIIAFRLFLFGLFTAASWLTAYFV